MTLSRLRAVAALVLGVGLLCGTAGAVALAARAPAAGLSAARAPLPATLPRTEPALAGHLIVLRDSKYVLVSPDGNVGAELPLRLGDDAFSGPVFSPDGKRYAFTFWDPHHNILSTSPRARHVCVRDTYGKADGFLDGFRVPVDATTAVWAPDGKGLLVAEQIYSGEPEKMGFVTSRLDLATRERTRLDLPRRALVSEVTPDGKAYVVTLVDAAFRKARLALVSLDGTEVTELVTTRFELPGPQMSPDGTRILYLDYDPADKYVEGFPTLYRLFVYDLRTKTARRLPGVPPDGRVTNRSWSPDGKRVAYSWNQLHRGVDDWEKPEDKDDPKQNVETESRVVLADADGANAVTLLSAKASRATASRLWLVGWR